MKLKRLGANQVLLNTNHGDEILYSCDMPVAGYLLKGGYFKTTEKHGVATTRHINSYLKHALNVSELTPEEIALRWEYTDE